MPPKRDATGSPTGTPSKLPKTETRPEDFSSSVKKRLQSSQRTGQACDRCKIRKIRCDGLPGGCSPCLHNQSECRTTDRITGRAAPRGYVDNLERQNRENEGRIRDLEHLLLQHGIEVKPANAYPDQAAYPYNSGSVNGNGNGNSTEWNASTAGGSFSTTRPSDSLVQAPQETNMFRTIPNIRTENIGDNYLGVSSGNSELSSIKGTALSILGVVIDVADFPSKDMDEPDRTTLREPLYNKSYQAFLQTALNVNPKLPKPDLPPREEGMSFTEMYFSVINPYLPLLHKPTFIKILTRVYDDPNFHPAVSELVMVHTVFAIMYFQWAIRNPQDNHRAQYNHLSNMHYHFALSSFYELCVGHTMEDVQALALLCAHLRNFPKPGASYGLVATTLEVAIEIGLHRSIKSRPASERSLSAHQIEMRKRTFWTIFAIHITLSGKLGRPMRLRSEDFDIELPELMEDDETATSIEAFRPSRSANAIGVVCLKLVLLFMDLHSTIYAPRRDPDTYVETVHRLETRLNQWSTEIPSEFANASSFADPHGEVFHLYTQVWACEFRLLLRHPSACLSKDRALQREGLHICLDSAREMLRIVNELRKLKCLDTTWYASTGYLGAMLTTLFAQWELRTEMTAANMADLRKEMNTWIDVMGDVGQMLGSGSRLQDTVRNATDGIFKVMNQFVSGRRKNLPITSAVNGNADSSSQTPHRRSISTHTVNTLNGYNGTGYQNGRSFPDPGTTAGGNNGTTNYLPTDGSLNHQQTPYPTATQYSDYPDPAAPANSISYQSNDAPAFSNYPNSTSNAAEAPLLAAFATQASQVAQQNWPRSQATEGNSLDAQMRWQNFATAMAGSVQPGRLEPADRYSADALMRLGGRGLESNENIAAHNPAVDINEAQAAAIAADSGLGGSVMNSNTIIWPYNLFDHASHPAG